MRINGNKVIELFKKSNDSWGKATALKNEANRLMNDSADALIRLNELIREAALYTYQIAPLISSVVEGNTISSIRVVIPTAGVSFHIHKDGRIVYEQ